MVIVVEIRVDSKAAADSIERLEGVQRHQFIRTVQRQRAALGLAIMIRKSPIARQKWGKNYQEGGLRKSHVIEKAFGDQVIIGPSVGYGKYVKWGIAGRGRSKMGPRPWDTWATIDFLRQEPMLIKKVADSILRG